MIFKEKSTIQIPKGVPMIIKDQPDFELITKKPFLPSEEEIEFNNRAHSAKMRCIEKTK